MEKLSKNLYSNNLTRQIVNALNGHREIRGAEGKRQPFWCLARGRWEGFREGRTPELSPMELRELGTE